MNRILVVLLGVLAAVTTWLLLPSKLVSVEPYEENVPQPIPNIDSGRALEEKPEEIILASEEGKATVNLNNKEIVISLSAPQVEQYWIDSSLSALETIESLLPKAEAGDIEAASQAAALLDRCNGKKLNRAAEKASQIQSLVDAGNFTQTYGQNMSYSTKNGQITNLFVNPETLAKSQQLHQQELSYCEGIAEELGSRAFELAQFAAERGDHSAQKLLLQLEYVNDQVGYETAKNIWENTGSLDALYQMSFLQSEALYVENAETLTGLAKALKPNPVLAFALELAATELSRAALEHRGQALTPNDIASSDQALAYSSRNLSAGDHAKAEELAHKIVSENKNCCTY